MLERDSSSGIMRTSPVTTESNTKKTQTKNNRDLVCFRPPVFFYAPQLQIIYYYIARYNEKNSTCAWGRKKLKNISPLSWGRGGARQNRTISRIFLSPPLLFDTHCFFMSTRYDMYCYIARYYGGVNYMLTKLDILSRIDPNNQ